MIALAAEYLMFQLANGESVAFSADMVSVEIEGDTERWFDEDFVSQAAKAVFHYFREELGRQTVTMGEFAGAMEKVLRGFRQVRSEATPAATQAAVAESDLVRLASESGEGCELMFFPRLRDELRQQLRQSPRVVRFYGLRSCVKQLAGAQRWSGRCRSLEDQIVDYLRECLRVEPQQASCAMVVE